jgi:galactose oxidase-like protein
MLRMTSIAVVLVFLVTVVACSGGPVSTSSANTTRGGSSSPSDPSARGAISIFPGSEILRTGGQRRFSGWDSTVGQYDVTWSLQEGAAAGTITTDGVYTAPLTPGTFHLIATSSHNTGLSATAPLTIVSVGFAAVDDMPVPRSGHTATLLADGKVLVAGGTTDKSHSADLFDPTASSFVPTTGAMIYTRTGHCAALLRTGRVLIAGGEDSNGTLFKTAEVFDPATGTFTATGDLNQFRAGATATPLANGKVLIAGGQDNDGALVSSAELYDPSTGTFSLTGNMQTARAQHTATLLSDGKVLLIGSTNPAGSAEIFDPASGHFSATGSLVQARAHHTATLLPGGKVLVLGGTQIAPPGGGGAPPAPVSLDSVEIYDPLSGTFQTAGKLLAARDSHSATLLLSGMVLVAGGYTHDFDGDAQPQWYTMFTAELFDPVISASTAVASLEGDRAEHVATILNNGQVLVTGGISGFFCCSFKPYGGVSLSSAELYK